MILGLFHAKNKTIPLYSVQINETLPQTTVTWSTLARRAAIIFFSDQNLTSFRTHWHTQQGLGLTANKINALSWESMNWFCTELICKPMHWWGEINALIVGIVDCENQWIDSQNQWFDYGINDLIWKSMNWFFGVNELILPINSLIWKSLHWVAFVVRMSELVLGVNDLILKSMNWSWGPMNWFWKSMHCFWNQ